MENDLVASRKEILPNEYEEFLLDQNGSVAILDLNGGRDMPVDDFYTKYGEYIVQFVEKEI